MGGSSYRSVNNENLNLTAMHLYQFAGMEASDLMVTKTDISSELKALCTGEGGNHYERFYDFDSNENYIASVDYCKLEKRELDPN